MKTIDLILQEAWYTREYLLLQRISGRTNGMGWKWGIQWTDELRKLKAFDSEEEHELLNDLDLISDIHDIEFENKDWDTLYKSITNFISANYRLIIRIIRLLHWTTTIWRLFIFTLGFFWLNIFGWRYFNIK